MAVTEYQYAISSEFPSQAVSLLGMRKEIDSSAIATAVDHLGMDEDGDAFSVWFTDALSAGDKTLLDSLVAAHGGVEPAAQDHYHLTGEGDVTTSSTSYVAVPDMELSPSYGTYILQFSCSVHASKNNTEIKMLIELDGATRSVSERTCRRGQGYTRNNVSVVDKIVVSKDAPLRVMWLVTGGSGTMGNRSLTLRKIK